MNALTWLLTSLALPLAAVCFRLEQPWSGAAKSPHLNKTWGHKRQSFDSGFGLGGANESLLVPQDSAAAARLTDKSLKDAGSTEKLPDIDVFKSLWTARYASEHHLNETLPSSIKLVLGVFTVPQDAAYRQVVRETWLQQTGACYWTDGPLDNCSVYVAFVLGMNGTGQRANVASLPAGELAKVYKEEGILRLDTTENMNTGKSFYWLFTALGMFPWATHIGKMDMDTYPFLHKLVNRMDANRSCVNEVSPYEFIGRARSVDGMETFTVACPYRPCLGKFLSKQDIQVLAKSGEWCFMAGERNFCVAVRRLDAWFHHNSWVDPVYSNDF